MMHEQVAKEIVDTLYGHSYSVSIASVLEGPSVSRYYLSDMKKIVTLSTSVRTQQATQWLSSRGYPVTTQAVRAVLGRKHNGGYLVPTHKVVPVTITDIEARIKDLRAAMRNPNIVMGLDESGGFYIEVPNDARAFFSPDEVHALAKRTAAWIYQSSDIAVPFGVNMDGTAAILNITQAPHVLVAGASGTGKSVAMHAIYESLTRQYSPQDIAVIPMDFKSGVEFVLWTGSRHWVTDHVVTSPSEAHGILTHLVRLVDRRMSILADARVQDINAWNTQSREKLPRILVIIDEIATLVGRIKKVNDPLIELGQKGRAAGIHFIVLTQRPSADVMVGSFKANMVTSIVLRAKDVVNSMVSLGAGGAQFLLTKGDALVTLPDAPYASRVQITHCEPKHIEAALAASTHYKRGPGLEDLR